MFVLTGAAAEVELDEFEEVDEVLEVEPVEVVGDIDSLFRLWNW
jgi:hypothetical protein